MSRGRILLGIGGAGITALAALFGTSQIKERNYQTKMRKFRETAKKVNGYISDLSAKQLWDKNTKVYDPEHEIWDKRFSYLKSKQWSEADLEYLPEDAKKNLAAFKNFCFETLESNANDIVGEHGLSASNIPPQKAYWTYCLVSELEFRQLNG
ncbi:hypothetical protein MHC_02975 [Mycoplasma haemocanis str. Illinois]|uniref:Uncharacterized protein n=1 Tax=Mycoplasma haemocanis (strain Illinois) TaxID=1111676 RepID=H6N735_MYCHN|nr:hypothetical protein [Mycoplasma haemocanis]AEW45457.1 hypothetical protein MHC_02975 [Mycoplasma haemocanis str. Illinois]